MALLAREKYEEREVFWQDLKMCVKEIKMRGSHVVMVGDLDD